MNRRLYLLLVLSVLVAMVVSACGSSATPTPTTAPTEAPTEEPTVDAQSAPTEDATVEATEDVAGGTGATEEATVEATEAEVEATEEPTVEATEAEVEATEEPTVEATEAEVEATEEPTVEATEAEVEATEEPTVEATEAEVEATEEPTVEATAEPTEEAVAVQPTEDTERATRVQEQRDTRATNVKATAEARSAAAPTEAPTEEAVEEPTAEATEVAVTGTDLSGTITNVCLVTDLGRVNDGTFNQFAYEGMQRAAEEFTLESNYIETTSQADYAANIQTCINDGYQAIVTVGFLIADATRAAAEANPELYFIGVDQFFADPLANLVGIQFREDQSGYLAGVMAALMTESNIVAGVYGAEIPPVVKFRNGFEQGAKSVNPDITTLGVYIPDFLAPAEGAEAAEAFIADGADVIFGAGGPTGSGGITRAAEQGVKVIGVDQDEFLTTFGEGETPGAEMIITSAVKRVDQGVYDMLQALSAGGVLWPAGSLYLMDAAVNGVGFAEAHLADVPEEVTAQIQATFDGLASGDISTGVDPVTGALLGAEPVEEAATEVPAEEPTAEPEPTEAPTEEAAAEPTEEASTDVEPAAATDLSGTITNVCLVTDLGRVNDGTFNQFAYEGMQRAAEEFTLESNYIETTSQADYAANIQTCINDGYQAIVTVGFLIADATRAAAEANPTLYFIGVDQFFAEPLANLVGIQFREDQSGYLAGVMAALMTESNIVAGVYGAEIPPVVKFRNGFEQGAKSVNPDITTLGVYIPDFLAPAEGAEAAEAFIADGADVIFGAGGPTGSGGITRAAEQGVKVIGVDQDEFLTTFGEGETPGAEMIITSAVKRVDQGVYDMLQALSAGGVLWPAGSLYLMDAAVNGVGFAEAHLADVPEEVTAQIQATFDGLASGEISTGVDPVTGALLEE